jgi:hypothetical protein
MASGFILSCRCPPSPESIARQNNERSGDREGEAEQANCLMKHEDKGFSAKGKKWSLKKETTTKQKAHGS